MNTFDRCKFLYLKEIVFDIKGELPIYACEKEHSVSNGCDKACPDTQPMIQNGQNIDRQNEHGKAPPF